MTILVVDVGDSITGLDGVLLAAKYPREIGAKLLVHHSFTYQHFVMTACLSAKQWTKLFCPIKD
jgi:hypothetical protein